MMTTPPVVPFFWKDPVLSINDLNIIVILFKYYLVRMYYFNYMSYLLKNLNFLFFLKAGFYLNIYRSYFFLKKFFKLQYIEKYNFLNYNINSYKFFELIEKKKSLFVINNIFFFKRSYLPFLLLEDFRFRFDVQFFFNLHNYAEFLRVFKYKEYIKGSSCLVSFSLVRDLLICNLYGYSLLNKINKFIPYTKRVRYYWEHRKLFLFNYYIFYIFFILILMELPQKQVNLFFITRLRNILCKNFLFFYFIQHLDRVIFTRHLTLTYYSFLHIHIYKHTVLIGYFFSKKIDVTSLEDYFNVVARFYFFEGSINHHLFFIFRACLQSLFFLNYGAVSFYSTSFFFDKKLKISLIPDSKFVDLYVNDLKHSLFYK